MTAAPSIDIKKALEKMRYSGLFCAIEKSAEVMPKMIAKRKGFGEVLAEGVKKAAETIGQGAEGFANEVKGLEVPMHEPRGKKAVGIMYATAARGAVHSDGYHDTGFQRPNVLPELGLIKSLDRKDLHGKPRLMISI